MQAGFKVEAEENGRILVDASEFFLRDAHGVAERLRAAKQGIYKLDDARSSIDPARTKGFARNTEVEAILTFATDGEAGKLVAETAASGQVVTVRLRHSLVALPPLDGRFKPRKADPRVGVFTVDFYDFATPFDQPVERQWIARHRLIKKDPSAAMSDPVEPIVYYVDPGAPEPIRQALVEGASWWKSAFEAAGFTNAFRVEVLPADADPMDLRYNMIQWVHRATRGWSYGSTCRRPSNGRDSQRARQPGLASWTAIRLDRHGADRGRGRQGRLCSRCDPGAGIPGGTLTGAPSFATSYWHAFASSRPTRSATRSGSPTTSPRAPAGVTR